MSPLRDVRKEGFWKKVNADRFFALEGADLHRTGAGQILPVSLLSVWNFNWTNLHRERRLRDRRTSHAGSL